MESLQAGIELSSVVIFQSWELTISRVKLEDGGEYLCQASTHPPLAIITTLDVVGSCQSQVNVDKLLQLGLSNWVKFSLQSTKIFIFGKVRL